MSTTVPAKLRFQHEEIKKTHGSKEMIGQYYLSEKSRFTSRDISHIVVSGAFGLEKTSCGGSSVQQSQ